MNTSRLLYLLVVTTATIMKANAEADNHSILAQGLSGLKGTYLHPFGKKSESVKHNVRRILNKANRKKLSSRVREDDDCCFCCCENNDDDESQNTSPTTTSPTANPTANPTYIEKKFLASDGSQLDYFGSSCSMTDDLVVISATDASGGVGAAYLFSLDGTEVTKLEPEDDGEGDEEYGDTISMDEKIVVGTGFDANYVRVFSRDGTYERTLTCVDCSTGFGTTVATLGDKIVTTGGTKLLIYTTDGELLKEEDYGEFLRDVAISDEYIVHITLTKIVVHSNSEPDFPLVREIEQGGRKVATAGDKLVIGDEQSNTSGSAWLYNIDGTLIKELEHDATIYASFMAVALLSQMKILLLVPTLTMWVVVTPVLCSSTLLSTEIFKRKFLHQMHKNTMDLELASVQMDHTMWLERLVMKQVLEQLICSTFLRKYDEFSYIQ